MKSILIAGQSNMAGRGFVTEVPAIYNENIQMLRNGRWQMMAEPINYDREVAGVGPSSAFAQAWSIDHPDEKLGIIPGAEGGSSIDEWHPSGVLARHALSEAKFAMESSELIGILWHQGENDSLDQRYESYQAKIEEVFAFFRAELGLPELPIIMGELPDFLGKTGFGQSATEFEEINQILHTVAEKDPNTFLVSAEKLAANPDGIHINAASQRKFGLRYYEAFKQKQTILAALPEEEAKVNALYQREPTVTEKIYLQSRAFAFGKMTYEQFLAAMSEIMK